MKLRIVKKWSGSRQEVLYFVQRRIFGCWWINLDWFYNVGTASKMVEGYEGAVVEIIK